MRTFQKVSPTFGLFGARSVYNVVTGCAAQHKLSASEGEGSPSGRSTRRGLVTTRGRNNNNDSDAHRSQLDGAKTIDKPVDCTVILTSTPLSASISCDPYQPNRANIHSLPNHPFNHSLPYHLLATNPQAYAFAQSALFSFLAIGLLFPVIAYLVKALGTAYEQRRLAHMLHKNASESHLQHQPHHDEQQQEEASVVDTPTTALAVKKPSHWSPSLRAAVAGARSIRSIEEESEVVSSSSLSSRLSVALGSAFVAAKFYAHSLLFHGFIDYPILSCFIVSIATPCCLRAFLQRVVHPRQVRRHWARVEKAKKATREEQQQQLRQKGAEKGAGVERERPTAVRKRRSSPSEEKSTHNKVEADKLKPLSAHYAETHQKVDAAGCITRHNEDDDQQQQMAKTRRSWAAIKKERLKRAGVVPLDAIAESILERQRAEEEQTKEKTKVNETAKETTRVAVEENEHKHGAPRESCEATLSSPQRSIPTRCKDELGEDQALKNDETSKQSTAQSSVLGGGDREMVREGERRIIFIPTTVPGQKDIVRPSSCFLLTARLLTLPTEPIVMPTTTTATTDPHHAYRRVSHSESYRYSLPIAPLAFPSALLSLLVMLLWLTLVVMFPPPRWNESGDTTAPTRSEGTNGVGVDANHSSATNGVEDSVASFPSTYSYYSLMESLVGMEAGGLVEALEATQGEARRRKARNNKGEQHGCHAAVNLTDETKTGGSLPTEAAVSGTSLLSAVRKEPSPPRWHEGGAKEHGSLLVSEEALLSRRKGF